ncbi:hypothetical protein CKO31_22970 [Thiohalocapsa halophila]|uniref:Uncharacterized protein n=1 Tax=Thiohalocapsa halophila TaxID=69359 RepID=A0ABS1CNZ0_9GAMM|nr:hypothetical protein [Thiohalocapsa halophila]MBK1633554.1 hypothetical protein [Thiohalocapsa halophila]
MVGERRPVWAFGGPRRIGPAEARLAARAARLLLDRGAEVVCGCATGADAAFMAAASDIDAERLQVCTAFGPVRATPGVAPAAPGACGHSAVRAVQLAAAAGAVVQPWAGGGPALPLAARLARRTRVVARASTAGAVVWLRPRSRGSLLLARAIAARGLEVVAVPLGCLPADLPPLDGAGSWRPPRSGSLAMELGGWCWAPAQRRLRV